jgi:tRNA (cytidine/uridine-2'-O-)-methyltransferase
MRLALYRPDIPENADAFRLAACLGVPVEAIVPVGSDLSDDALRRVSPDYLAHVDLTNTKTGRRSSPGAKPLATLGSCT